MKYGIVIKEVQKELNLIIKNYILFLYINPCSYLKSTFSKITNCYQNPLVFILMILILLYLFPNKLSSDSISRIDLINQSSNSYNYGLVLPANFNPKKKYLLGICLHGLGGNGIEFAEKLGYYTRYMNMILACPNGNFPDTNRKSTRWGYKNSEEYIINFESIIREKYNLFPGTLLIGFSQGGNQGILTSLLHPTTFPYFIGISGGYYNLSEDLVAILPEVKILLISGNNGSGEKYTKRVLDEKYNLYKKNKNINRKVLKGEKHFVSSRMAYSSLRWYASINKNFKKGFWIFKGNYFYHFEKAEELRKEGNYKESIDLYKKSLKINPVFPPSHLGYARSSLMNGSITQFRKSIFKVLEFYSLFPEYEPIEIFEMMDDIYKTFYRDKSLKEFFANFLSDRIESYQKSFSPIYNGEVYFLLSRLYKDLGDQESLSDSIDKAKYFYSQLNEEDYFYSIGSVSAKLEILKKMESGK